MTITSVQQAAPGTPDEIARAATELISLADGIDDARQHVKRLVDGLSRGDDVLRGIAARAFAHEFKDLPRDLGRFSSTAHDVGSALKHWSADVGTLQEEARRALTRYEAEKRRRDTASTQVSSLASRLRELRGAITDSEVRATGHLKDHKREALLGQSEKADQSYQQYLKEFRAKSQLQGKWTTADQEHARQRKEQEAAEAAMRSAQGDLERILDRHGDRDRAAAKVIEAALPKELKNKSNLEKAFNATVNALKDAGSWIAEYADTYLDMLDALLDGDWDRAVFRFRELVDMITPILGAVLMVLAVVALFIPVPGLNVLLAAALVLAVARFASTAFLLGRDADDPDHPGKKAASWTELIIDGISVVAAALAFKFPPQVKGNSSWASGGRQFLKGEPAKGLLKYTPTRLRQPVAILMKTHPGWTNALQGTQIYVTAKYVKPPINKFVIEKTAQVGSDVTGMDRDRLESYITIADDGSKIVKSYHGLAKVPEGHHYEAELKTRTAMKTSVGKTKSLISEIEKLKDKEKPEAVFSGGGFGGGGSWGSGSSGFDHGSSGGGGGGGGGGSW